MVMERFVKAAGRKDGVRYQQADRIPMTDKVRALNVSNSVAIVIYEALRQQNYNNLLMEEPHKGNDFLERD